MILIFQGPWHTHLKYYHTGGKFTVGFLLAILTNKVRSSDGSFWSGPVLRALPTSLHFIQSSICEALGKFSIWTRQSQDSVQENLTPYPSL